MILHELRGKKMNFIFGPNFGTCLEQFPLMMLLSGRIPNKFGMDKVLGFGFFLALILPFSPAASGSMMKCAVANRFGRVSDCLFHARFGLILWTVGQHLQCLADEGGRARTEGKSEGRGNRKPSVS